MKGNSECIACPTGQYKAAGAHSDMSCDLFSSCAIGHVRVTSTDGATSQGNCEVCADGSFKDTRGAWDTQCTPHTACADNHFSDPATEVLTANEDRQCTRHRASCNSNQYLDESVPASTTTDIMCHAVSAECDGVLTWQSAGSTSTSDRECVSFSAPCVQDLTFEEVAPSVNSDRVCAPVTICNSATHYMSSPPTTHADTGCTPFIDCSPIEDFITVRPSKDDRDKSTFPGIALYTADRTCNERVPCHEIFQRVKVSDLFQEQCEDLKTFAYIMPIQGLTSAEATTSANADWEERLDEKRQQGTDVAMSNDADGFASDREFNVKGFTISTTGDGKLELIVLVVFGDNTGRARRERTRIGRGSGGTLGDVVQLPEGTTKCAADTDELCCIAGFGSGDGSTCTQCINGEYTDSETKVSNQVGCLAQPACGVDNEPPTFFRSLDMSRTEHAVDNCELLTVCHEQGLLMSQAPTDGSDRQCGSAVVLCDATTEYWSDDAQFDEAVLEWTANPTCLAMETCAVGTFWANADAFRLKSQIPIYTAQRNCVARKTCGASEYLANPLQVAAEGANSVVDNECSAWTVCTVGEQYQTMEPSGTENRICVDLTSCEASQYEVTEATPMSDRGCADVEDCPDGQYLRKAATSTADRVCSIWKECATDTQYQCTAPSGLVNRECCNIKECSGSEVQTAAPTPTSNRVCATFGCEGLHVNYDTRARLRMCNSKWTACSSIELKNDPVCNSA